MSGCGRLAVDVVRADIVIENFVRRGEFEEDAMASVDRVGPEAFQASLQSMGPQPWIEGVLTEDPISGVSHVLECRRQSSVGSLEVWGHADPHDTARGSAQTLNSLSDLTDRVRPSWRASRPASTNSSTSFAVSLRFRPDGLEDPKSMARQGILMTSPSGVTDTVGWRELIIFSRFSSQTQSQRQRTRYPSIADEKTSTVNGVEVARFKP